MPPIHFGALVYEWQAIDVLGPFDLLNSSSKWVLEYVKKHGGINQKTIDQAPEFVFHYIGETLDPVRLLTSSVTIAPTTTIEECPKLDYLLIGGPAPEDFKLPPKYVEYIKKHDSAGKTIFTTCTGAAVLASTGVLDGRHATVNNVEYNWVAAEYPKVKWSRDKKWVVDGNIWTGSGAVAGMDMFAHWILVNFGRDVLVGGALGLDYEPRDVDGNFTVLPKHVFP